VSDYQSDMTGNLAHFDATKTCVAEVFRIADRHPQCNKLLRIKNTCNDLLRGNKVYMARDTAAYLLAQAIEIENGLWKRKSAKQSAGRC
jgi:hypothetical protein